VDFSGSNSVDTLSLDNDKILQHTSAVIRRSKVSP
jgi:hypothetical protein